MSQHSIIGNISPELMDEIYHKYLNNPDSLDGSWKQFFLGFDFARAHFEDNAEAVPEKVNKEFKVITLINSYRTRGHLFTKTNPVRERRQYQPTLAVENFGLTQSDLETIFSAGQEIGIGPAKLKDIIAHLEETYCESVGAEYKYIRNPEVINWLQFRMEGSKNHQSFSIKEKKRIR